MFLSNKRRAFTLLELIVVVVILAILATIAFISYSGYVTESNDTKRMTDVSNAHSSLGIFLAKHSSLPASDSLVEMKVSGSVVGYQGKLDSSLQSILGISGGTPDAYITMNTAGTKQSAFSILENPTHANVTTLPEVYIFQKGDFSPIAVSSGSHVPLDPSNGGGLSIELDPDYVVVAGATVYSGSTLASAYSETPVITPPAAPEVGFVYNLPFQNVTADKLYQGSVPGGIYGSMMNTDTSQWALYALNTAGMSYINDFHASSFAYHGGTSYFFTNASGYGDSLWKTDGTPAGTVMVVDVNPGTGTMDPDYSRTKSALGTLFFMANDGTHGAELWKTDGTPGNTAMVSDINPGANGSVEYNLADMGWRANQYSMEFWGMLYFTANDGTHGAELWKTDGTPGNTAMVSDIYPGLDSSYPKDFAVFNGDLYFTAHTFSPVESGRQLFRLDHSSGIVTQLTSDGGGDTWPLVAGASKLYFAHNEVTYGNEIWETDGTLGGTVRSTDIFPGAGNGVISDYSQIFKIIGNTLVFDGQEEDQWGTPQMFGMNLSDHSVAPITPLWSSNSKSYVFNGRLYFSRYDDTYGDELWSTDGLSEATMVTDLNPGADGSELDLRSMAFENGGYLYFVATVSGVRGLYRVQ